MLIVISVNLLEYHILLLHLHTMFPSNSVTNSVLRILYIHMYIQYIHVYVYIHSNAFPLDIKILRS